MAWTAPMTFVANSVLTAAQLNTHLTANLMECPAAKASAEGGYFIADGANSITERFPATSRVSTVGTTTSTSFTDLTGGGIGPSVTVETGTRALVFIGCATSNNLADRLCAVSFELSGSTVRTAIDATSARIDGISANNAVTAYSTDLLTDLDPGTTTFTLKYKVGSGTGTFYDRFIAVIPL